MGACLVLVAVIPIGGLTLGMMPYTDPNAQRMANRERVSPLWLAGTLMAPTAGDWNVPIDSRQPQIPTRCRMTPLPRVRRLLDYRGTEGG